MKTSPVSLLANSPTCILPFILANANKDHEFLIPCITGPLLVAIILSPSQEHCCL
nr:MAG TPA: hypothetical protein [Caudoviricetes sp.]